MQLSFNIARTAVSNLSLAVLINALLFCFIYWLVTPEYKQLPDHEHPQMVEFIRLKQPPKEPEPPPREKPPEKPKQERVPTPNKVVVLRPNKPRIDRLRIKAPDVDIPTRISGGPQLGDFEPAPMEDAGSQGLELDLNAEPIVRVEPIYPPRAQRQGLEGVVTVEFIITPSGRVTDPVVINAKPSKVFDRAVLAAVKKWKFRPRIVNGKAVARRARQAIQFTLKS